MRILICGGRDFGDIDRELQHHEPDHYRVRKAEKEFDFVWKTLDNYIDFDVDIISGGATGVDTIADLWAESNGFPFLEFSISKEEWNKYGKAAGYLRNARMLSEGKPDLVIAFPGGRGTQMMVKLAKAKGVQVIEYTYPENP